MKPAALLLLVPLSVPLAQTIEAATLHVPSEFATIRFALAAAASGDMVVVACGVYYEHDLVLPAGVTLQGGANSSCVTINAQRLGRVIAVNGAAGVVVRGITFTNGRTTREGGAVYCSDASLTMIDCQVTSSEAWDVGGGVALEHSQLVASGCRFSGNLASALSYGHGFGGGLALYSSSDGQLENCIIDDNRVSWAIVTPSGGGISCLESSLRLTGCTIVRNGLHFDDLGINGGGVYLESSNAVIQNTIIAFNTHGEAIGCGGGASAGVKCSDIYGNPGGDWVGCVAGQDAAYGNVSLDPLFCAMTHGDYSLSEGSPCLASPICSTVGALGAGCSVQTGVEGQRLVRTTWGGAKSRIGTSPSR